MTCQITNFWILSQLYGSVLLSQATDFGQAYCKVQLLWEGHKNLELLLSKRQIKWKITPNFVAFLEKLNFSIPHTFTYVPKILAILKK